MVPQEAESIKTSFAGSNWKGMGILNRKDVRRFCVGCIVAYLLFALLFWAVANDQLRFREENTNAIHASSMIGELVQGVELRQPFRAEADELLNLSMMMSTYIRENTSHLLLRIEDMNGDAVAQIEVPLQDALDNAVHLVPFDRPIPVTRGDMYTLVITTADGVLGNAVTLWYGNTVATVHAEVEKKIPEEERLRINGELQNGMLHYSFRTRSYLWLGRHYWPAAFAVGLLLVTALLHLDIAAGKGKSTTGLRMLAAFLQYGYLMRQLVARDFKTKYKRSVLGILWSFLNPLLTMAVQYIVFSTLFRSDIPNFPLYLLTGIVCFNFFNEASNMTLQSIVGNAALITKVYVPKYIYPVSRVLSSMINLLLSLLPLFAVMLLTHTPFRPALLLLPFGLVCLVAFSLGVGFFLSTSMVFFRDTQFLWGVLSMLWMYLTPIFYPESIIPGQYMLLYKCNPLYHIIRFFRIVLMDGVSPEPKAYLLCIIVSVLPLAAGALFFKKQQDKFILNL